jgi:hypothetical protein
VPLEPVFDVGGDDNLFKCSNHNLELVFVRSDLRDILGHTDLETLMHFNDLKFITNCVNCITILSNL